LTARDPPAPSCFARGSKVISNLSLLLPSWLFEDTFESPGCSNWINKGGNLNLSCGCPPNAAIGADRPVILLTSVIGAGFSQRFLSSAGGRHNE
jgi:hypothetical protein